MRGRRLEKTGSLFAGIRLRIFWGREQWNEESGLARMVKDVVDQLRQSRVPEACREINLPQTAFLHGVADGLPAAGPAGV
jgi:hypothetical protein